MGMIKNRTVPLSDPHASSKTTGIYTHVSTKSLGKIRSPLDNLNLEGGDIDKI